MPTVNPDPSACVSVVVAAEANFIVNATASVTARARTNLALHHLFAACRFSAQLKRIESENIGAPFGAFWEEILHYSLGVAALSVASLESYANEHLADGAIITSSLHPNAAQAIAALIDRESIIGKFNLLLQLRTGQSLDLGATVVQNVDLLIKLRNAVVHFRPEWDDEQNSHRKLSSKLESKLDRSPYFPGEDLFPRAWATRSFSCWALKTTIDFLDHFGQQSGLDSKLEPFRGRVTQLSEGAV